MRLRKHLAFVLAAALGFALAVLPAVASSEPTPSIEAYEYGGGSYRYWLPASATIAPGGAVKFANPYAGIKHGLQFTVGPATPVCSGVPTEPGGATSWHGECTFSTPGTYTFICTVHPTEMKGTITVTAPGGTTSPTTSNSSPPQTGTTPSSPGTGGGTGPGGETTPNPTGSVSPYAGLQPLGLAPGLHGAVVHGVVAVSAAGAGGRLEVDALAARASLAEARAATVTIARFVRAHVPAGRVAFTLRLDRAALRALARRHTLRLTVRSQLTPPQPDAPIATRSRTLVLHR